jgi:broad specificity phosphatase PhoE
VPDEPAAGHRTVLVRHGETEWSASGRHTSVTDLALTPAGRAEAVAAGRHLKGQSFALVLSSPRLRALETCRLAGFERRVEVDADLAEWEYGRYEGRTSAEIDALQPGWSLWTDGCPGGEQPIQVAARADRVITRCRDADGDAVVFAHGHLLRVLGARWIGLGPEMGRSLILATAALATLGWDRRTPAIVSWNETG